MKNTFKLLPLCAALAWSGVATTAWAQTGPQDALLQKLEQMSAELQRLKAEVSQLKAAQTQTEATAQQASQNAAQAQMAVAAQPVYGTDLKGPATVLTSYGEINYNRPTKRTNDTQADLRRAVLGIQHRFDDKTKFVGEFECEH